MYLVGRFHGHIAGGRDGFVDHAHEAVAGGGLGGAGGGGGAEAGEIGGTAVRTAGTRLADLVYLKINRVFF